MSARKPVIVGAFVVGALVLAVAAILIFGGLHLFASTLRIVAVFPDSIAGLEEGAPVTFRGLRIGRVERMKLHIDVLHHLTWIPVYLDVDLGRISWTSGPPEDPRVDLQAAVAAGLRAQLVSQSLVSGQMSVDLEYYPGTPARLSGHGGDAVEIPTVPSDLENIKEQLRKLDLPAISQRMEATLASMQRVLDDIGGKIDPLASSVQTTLATTNSAVLDLERVAARTSANIDRLSDESRSQIRVNGQDLDQLLRAADRTVNQADALIASLSTMSSPRGDLQASLRDLAASASSLRDLTNDLNHAPLRTLLRKDKQ